MDDTIFIVARAVPNGVGRGWLPVYTVNGHSHGDTYAATGYSADEALIIARQMAEEEAARHIGDWVIAVAIAKEDAEEVA